MIESKKDISILAYNQYVRTVLSDFYAKAEPIGRKTRKKINWDRSDEEIDKD